MYNIKRLQDFAQPSYVYNCSIAPNPDQASAITYPWVIRKTSDTPITDAKKSEIKDILTNCKQLCIAHDPSGDIALIDADIAKIS